MACQSSVRLRGYDEKLRSRRCIRAQKARSLSVVPMGVNLPVSRRFTRRTVPLWAKAQCLPHSSRTKGCVLARLTGPRVRLRTCARASSVFIGLCLMYAASGLCAAAVGSRNTRVALPS